MANCYQTDEIVCPYCYHTHQDSYEWDPPQHGPEGDGTSECHECGKEFNVSRYVYYKYQTSEM